MPKVRSLVVALLPLAVALTAFGCAASTTSGSSSTPDESKVIVVGCDDFSPFTYNDESGNLTGIDVEIISEACRRIGYEARCTFID